MDLTSSYVPPVSLFIYLIAWLGWLGAGGFILWTYFNDFWTRFFPAEIGRPVGAFVAVFWIISLFILKAAAGRFYGDSDEAPPAYLTQQEQTVEYHPPHLFNTELLASLVHGYAMIGWLTLIVGAFLIWRFLRG